MGLPVRVVRAAAAADWGAGDDDDGGTRVEAVEIVDIVSESLCWAIFVSLVLLFLDGLGF
jgi:hypothetical protein